MDANELSEQLALAAIYAYEASGNGILCNIRLTPMGFEVSAKTTDGSVREIRRTLGFLEVVLAKGALLHAAIDLCVDRLGVADHAA